MFFWDRAISERLDGLLGGGFFRTWDAPWTVIVLLALALAWVLWVTSRCADRH
jgi:hypothetical protein